MVSREIKVSDESPGAPTPELAAKAGDHLTHETVEVYETTNLGNRVKVKSGVYVNRSSPLEKLFYAKRPKIDLDLFSAGQRFFSDWYGAGLMQGMVPDPTRTIVDGGGSRDESDRVLACRQRVEHALRALSVTQLHVIDAIVIREVDLASYAETLTRYRERRVRQAVAEDRIVDALSALLRHYSGRGPVRGSLRGAMANDAKPFDRPELREQP